MHHEADRNSLKSCGAAYSEGKGGGGEGRGRGGRRGGRKGRGKGGEGRGRGGEGREHTNTKLKRVEQMNGSRMKDME